MPKKGFMVPATSRLCTVVDSREIKEVRKIGIDLEIPDSDVLRLAVQVLIERYRQISTESISLKGAAAFSLMDGEKVELPEPEVETEIGHRDCEKLF
jgi:hypothetical protein